MNIGEVIRYERYKYGFRDRLEQIESYIGRIVEIIQPNEVFDINKFKRYSTIEPTPEIMSNIARSQFQRIIVQTKEQTKTEDAKYELIEIIPYCLEVGTQRITVIKEGLPNDLNYLLRMREY